MATKTFKIGLSNTDKQNMAQDVYERLLALTFPEYDSAEEYNVGDFVVYNDQLYKCIGATTGAWDSTKWQLATLNDLVTDIEGAVAFVNDKANVDGNYPTMTVGAAENLTPYSEESGTDQDEPFNFQATATANGSNPLFSASGLALMKEKRGNAVVVNQWVNTLPITQTKDGVTFTNNGDGTITLSGSLSADYTIIDFSLGNINIEHKALYLGSPDGNDKIVVYNGSTDDMIAVAGSAYCYILVRRNADLSTPITIRPLVIDLTQWFNGNSNIPQDLLDHPNHFFRYYQGSLAYNEGTLVNANGRYLKTIGRNQFDKNTQVESQIVNSENGNLNPSAIFNTSDFIMVNPNSIYYAKDVIGAGTAYTVFYYDKDKNYISAGLIGSTIGVASGTFTVPANCIYIRVSYYKEQTNNVVISIYYEDESGYDQYYPYEVLTNNDTGNEILRSAGSVADIKLPDGTIKRNVGVVDLGTLSWTYDSTYGAWYSNEQSAIKPVVENYIVASVVSNNYVVDSVTNIIGSSKKLNTVGINNATNPNIWLYNGSDSVQPSGSLLYELKTPTTEQGTAFSENVLIDDFGTMDFGGTNGVPQGNKIFYAIDYKSFIDTTYNYTDGDPSNLALNSELNAKFESYLKSLTGYNASETQVLKNVEGTLTWVTEGE